MTMRRSVIAAVLLGLLTTACHGKDECIKTSMHANKVRMVDTVDVDRSHIARARLKARGRGLEGRRVHFYVQRTDPTGDAPPSWRFVDEARTGRKGWAAADLLDRDIDDVIEDLDADTWAAVFPGGKRYCHSGDEAPIQLLRVGVPTIEPPSPDGTAVKDETGPVPADPGPRADEAPLPSPLRTVLDGARR